MQKPSLSTLNLLFDADRWPEFIDVRAPVVSAEPAVPSLVFDIIIHPEISYFSGHFPEQAVLPGVVQVHWAAKLGLLWVEANAVGNILLESSIQLNKVKFNNPVLPAYQLSLELKYRAEKRQLTFHYVNAQHTFSSGIITFTVPAMSKDPVTEREPSAERGPFAK